MNLMLIKSEHIQNNLTKIVGRQLTHLNEVQRLIKGDTVRVGEVNGAIGMGTIISIDEQTAMIEVNLTLRPPAPLPITVILALPRPKMLRRILQTISAMGVKNVYLVNASRVEKSFWQSPLLAPESIEEQLLLGLEQSRDTLLPAVHLRKLFKPFVEDELEGIVGESTAIVAHPISEQRCPIDCQVPITLAIGPEGGFIPFEIEKLIQAGFDPVHLGRRILRVENAVPALLSRLYPA
ncbi:MAG: 16S rRNA (uracil(1498)-N(3))-methyltransferase [Porticoccaceae bacterium]|nr:16S rRNA (uracil(1498)-N(3))-methyltransferase [Porticoccaceae bacterium]